MPKMVIIYFNSVFKFNLFYNHTRILTNFITELDFNLKQINVILSDLSADKMSNQSNLLIFDSKLPAFTIEIKLALEYDNYRIS
ncbi:hypothetical protein BpHYR1_003480 [Brachionus plicatilis]|uniref:Uncharacterized protein n=1 Tax=Brachionus plicatilis TaxID=10195 RepID=A0A3M7T0M9_BRAPC|nr:hypothetical protein BpHYR1_003480 [Brachionus plicatilis]